MNKKIILSLFALMMAISAWEERHTSETCSDEHGYPVDHHHGHHHGRRHRHKRRHRHNAKYTVADNWATQGSQKGRAQAFSQGKGASSVRAGPKGGAQASSRGTHGSGSKTAYKDHVHSVRDNWSRYSDRHGNQHATRDNWATKRHSNNNAQARAHGRGKTAAVSN